MEDQSNVAGIIGALGALGIEGYQLSQGQQVSTTLGPGGASVIQSGQAQNQSTLFLIIVGLGIVLVLAYLVIR